MPNILPVSDLRNYNEVLKNCQVGEPVFLTKNGRGKFVVMDIEDYEREKAEKKLLMKKLRINPIVAEDLKNIKEYIAEDNEEMAVKTIQEIYARIENIQQFPYMGADLAKRVSFRTDYKYVICGNYVVLYKIGKEYVGVCRVVNRYQDITKIF